MNISTKIKTQKSHLLFFQLHALYKIGGENLVFRHFAAHFPPNSGGIDCWVAELNAALCLDTWKK